MTSLLNNCYQFVGDCSGFDVLPNAFGQLKRVRTHFALQMSMPLLPRCQRCRQENLPTQSGVGRRRKADAIWRCTVSDDLLKRHRMSSIALNGSAPARSSLLMNATRGTEYLLQSEGTTAGTFSSGGRPYWFAIARQPHRRAPTQHRREHEELARLRL